jgi:anti-sigma B factor antagonist
MLSEESQFDRGRKPQEVCQMGTAPNGPGASANAGHEFRVFEVPVEDWGVVLAITGEIDIATAPRLRERLNMVIDRAIKRVVIDLSMVDFIDSVALGVVVHVKNRLGADGRLAVVAEEGSYTMLIFEAAGLDSVVDLFQSRAEAIAHVTP